jgi:hypothetical protein
VFGAMMDGGVSTEIGRRYVERGKSVLRADDDVFVRSGTMFEQ